jgi:chemotaxis protein methyltransferase CheR
MRTQEYNFIKHKIHKLMDVDLNCYKSTQMQRRLETYLLQSGHATWVSFFRAIENDAVAIGKLKDYLTINVSSFFRDPERFEHLRKHLLPDMLKHSPRLRMWSAGCSHGQEPYSLAMLLAEAVGSNSQHFILATDLDRSALDRARAGGPYSADNVANVSTRLLRRYFREYNGSYYVNEQLRRQVIFRQHNLLQSSFESGFDLIVCRNVIIYFTAEIKEHLYKRFHDALRPGGMFFAGNTEVISQAANMGFKATGASFYRRNGVV